MNNEWFCNVLRCHAFVLPKLLDLFGVSSSWSLSVESSGPSRRGASWFRLYRWNQSHTAAQAQNWLHAKTVRMTFIFVWVVFFFLIITGLLALLGLEISLQEWFSTIKYWMRKLQCHFSRRCNPMLRLVWSSTCNTTRFLLQVHRKHQWPNLNCFAYSVTSVAFARHVCWLSLIQCALTLNIDMKTILPLKSHCSQDPKRIFEFISRFGSLCGLKTCANEFALVSPWYHTCECRRVPYFRELWRSIPGLQWRCYFPNTRQSLRIHVRLFSIDSNGYILFQDYVCQFCNNEISKNSAATFVRSWSLACAVSMTVCILWI